MERINNHQAQTEQSKGESIIIDIRELQECKEHHIPGALNIKSTKYSKEDYGPFKDKNIYLICESGKRAEQIQSKLIPE